MVPIGQEVEAGDESDDEGKSENESKGESEGFYSKPRSKSGKK